MTPIEIVLGRHGYEILTGVADTDLTGKNIVAVVVREAGATLAKLEVGTVDILSTRTGLDTALNSSDAPILAGHEGNTKLFTAIQLTNETDSVMLVYGKPNAGE